MLKSMLRSILHGLEMMTNFAREKLGYEPVNTNDVEKKINVEWE